MKRYQKEEIEKVKDALLNGEIVAFGTDTVFGLACIYDNLNAISKIYEAKNREAKKPLPMMCNSPLMIDSVAYVNEAAKKIMKAFVPGAITLIFKKKDTINDVVTCGKETIGIRVPNDEWILKLIDLVGKPLLVTSANISNEPSLSKWKEVEKSLEGRIDGIVCEDARGDLASTIVDCSKEEIKILRQGPISEEAIKEVLKQ